MSPFNVVRRPGLLPAPGFEYIDEVLASGIASMVIYQLPQGGNAGYQIRGMIQKSARSAERRRHEVYGDELSRELGHPVGVGILS